jgi:hypothetical protein
LEGYKLAQEKLCQKLSESGQSSDHWFEVVAAFAEEEGVVNEAEVDTIGEGYKQGQMVVGVDLGSMLVLVLVLVLGPGQRGEQSQAQTPRVRVRERVQVQLLVQVQV